VDLRKNSKTFRKYFSIKLSDQNCTSIYIPPGFAHGFLTLKKENIVCYSCTEYRSPKNERSLFYNDEELRINWPINNPILSKRDKSANKLNHYFK
jgi:dTDP-4-dehydrorhamnose 3,5-epimerase